MIAGFGIIHYKYKFLNRIYFVKSNALHTTKSMFVFPRGNFVIGSNGAFETALNI